MEKLSKLFRKYLESILIGSMCILALIAVAASVQHFFTLLSVLILVGVCIYLIWRIK